MRYLLFILFVLLAHGAFAQKADSMDLVRRVSDLNKALVSKDTFRLKMIMRDDIHYYHSNGWLQTKREVIEDLYNGKLSYNKLLATDQSVHIMGNNLAQAKMIVEVEAVMNGKPIKLDLNVIQMWGWKNGRWELFSRLSKRVVKQDDLK